MSAAPVRARRRRGLANALPPNPLPLGRRLTLATVISLMVVVLTVGMTAWLATMWSLYRELDRDVVSIGQQVRGTLQGDIDDFDNLTPEVTNATRISFVLVRADGTVTQVQGADTVLAPGDAELAAARTQQESDPHNIQTTSGTYRAAAFPFTHNGLRYALVVGRPVDSTEATLARLWVVLVAVGLIGVSVTALSAWLVSRQVLRPINDLATAVTRVTDTDDLTPIEAGKGDDLGELREAFNAMLGSLAQSRERQRRLIGDAGHELRTPLTSMRTNVELLVADENSHMLPDGARGEILQDVAAQLGEFTSLVGDLVQLSREDKAMPAPEALDLADVVENAVTRVRRRARSAEVRFDVRLAPLMLKGEPDTLERAVTNLLDNAVKFSPPGGVVSVRLEGELLRISDQGPGIAEEDLPHVFERFYRSDRARNTPGTGLGLSIVAHTVQAHGGWVKAGRSATGGAEFTIRLPADDSLTPDLDDDDAL